MLQYRSLLGREKVPWRYACNRDGTHVVALKLESALLSLLFARASEADMEDGERRQGWTVRPRAPRPGHRTVRSTARCTNGDRDARRFHCNFEIDAIK